MNLFNANIRSTLSFKFYSFTTNFNMECFPMQNVSNCEMGFPYYVTSDTPLRDDYDSPRNTLTAGYCDCTNVEENIFNIAPILIANNPQPLLLVGEYNYTQEMYLFMFKTIETALKSVECLNIKYEPEKGRWLCVYGTMRIFKQLSPEQQNIYYRKLSLFYPKWSFNFKDKKNSFETIYLTNMLKLPFNYFLKAGINDYMRCKLRNEIIDKAHKMFPHSTTGQTDLFDIYSLLDDGILGNRAIKKWSKFEIVLRKNSITNKLSIFFNRISGDYISSTFVMNKIKECLIYAPTDYIWSLRKNYIQFVEGIQKLNSNHIEKYILNNLIVREIASYMH